MSTGIRFFHASLLAALFCTPSFAAQPAKALESPDFFVRVELSADAEKWFRQTGETITVSAIFQDEIGPGNLLLGSADLTLTQERMAHIQGIAFQPRLAQLLAGFDYEARVNVSSGRKTTDLNVLDCDPRQGNISEFRQRTLQISCRFIKPSASLKSIKRFTGAMNAKEFLGTCSSAGLSSENPAERQNEGFCTGYVKGVIHAHEGFLSDDSLAKRHFCIPRDVSDLAFTRAVVSHLESAGAGDQLATHTLAALHDTYACKPSAR